MLTMLLGYVRETKEVSSHCCIHCPYYQCEVSVCNWPKRTNAKKIYDIYIQGTAVVCTGPCECMLVCVGEGNRSAQQSDYNLGCQASPSMLFKGLLVLGANYVLQTSQSISLQALGSLHPIPPPPLQGQDYKEVYYCYRLLVASRVQKQASVLYPKLSLQPWNVHFDGSQRVLYLSICSKILFGL